MGANASSGPVVIVVDIEYLIYIYVRAMIASHATAADLQLRPCQVAMPSRIGAYGRSDR
jgi:hypothetical protein